MYHIELISTPVLRKCGIENVPSIKIINAASSGEGLEGGGEP